MKVFIRIDDKVYADADIDEALIDCAAADCVTGVERDVVAAKLIATELEAYICALLGMLRARIENNANNP